MDEQDSPPPLPLRKATGPRHFIAELRQRNVFKVAVGYLISGWLMIQLVNAIFPVFDFPRWTSQFVILLVFLGFPVVLLLSWAFELTSEGVKLTSAVEPATSIAPQTGKKLNAWIIALLSVLVIFMLVERVFFAGASTESPAIAVVESGASQNTLEATPIQPISVISDKSIAVLPLEDFNAGGEEAYFADGLTEEILNALTRTPDLLVASRTSSFQYKDQAVDVQEVAAALGVAHILEGSVRRSSTRLRITVQLIRASDGFHLWSENYDRQPDDIIEVQEDIAFQIATALQTAMDPAALSQMMQAGTRSVPAYNAYLNGLAIIQLANRSMPREAYDFFETARQADPRFAAAHNFAARYWQDQLTPNLIGGLIEANPAVEKLALFQQRISAAIDNAQAPMLYFYQAQEATVNLQLRLALGYLQRYMRERPNDYVMTASDENSVIELAVLLGEKELAMSVVETAAASPSLDAIFAARIVNTFFIIGEYAKGREFALQALDRFPYAEGLFYQSHRLLVSGSYIDEARELADRATGIELPRENLLLIQLRQACADGNIAQAETLATELLSGTSDAGWHVLHLMNRIDEATEFLRSLDQPGGLYSLAAYLDYPFFDASQYPNLQRVLEQERIVRPAYEPISYACNR